ncbi:hypothetical protein BCV71DRAFT_276931 [Rhizopus microsporus]|uniref:Uncharacterized protein n=1 Tax=Rhizopus microsporus TaxID=58291 RepID=A0A1X0SAG0_RHIZD|nr:hypothetical protein BCV71DRAFT_276931 [Rhizopus microsporus]
MDWEQNIEPFNIRASMMLAEDMEVHEAKKKNNFYSDKQRALFYCYNMMKLWKAGVSKRIAQAWAKRLKKDPS